MRNLQIRPQFQVLLFLLICLFLCSIPLDASCARCRPALGICTGRRYCRPALGICTGELSLWGYGDYMLLWRKKRDFPPLITTSPLGTPQIFAGILDLPTTSILFGNEHISVSPQSGARFGAGIWLDKRGYYGFGATVFTVGNEKKKFTVNGDETPILARPYLDVVFNQQEASLIAFPDVAIGSIAMKTKNSMWGADVYFAHRFYKCGCATVDGILGFAYASIEDNFKASTRSLNDDFFSMNFGTLTEVKDRFHAHNEFQGGLIGFDIKAICSCFTLETIAKLGIGSNRNHLNIHGSTVTTTPEFLPVTTPGGLLALPTNIGEHSRNRFCFMPYLEVKLLYHYWKRVQFSLGYTVYFWNHVILSGDQIDTGLNLTQQNGNPLVGPSRPHVNFRDTSFWLQGFTTGIRVCF